MNTLARRLIFAVTLSVVAVPALAAVSAREREAEQKAEAAQNQAEQAAQRAAAAHAPPAAIPGAAANPDAVIPSDKAAADLPPNEALFDAIARGDVMAARDAMNRGALLDAHNVLGQTPLDASIDLNRNDITFMLLSLRGAVGVSARPMPASATVPGPAGKKPSKLAGGKRQKAGSSAQAVAARSIADPGTPKPESGFLGF